MKCIEHNEVDAVINCAACGAGLCKECEQNSAFRQDNKPLCRNCNRLMAADYASNSEMLIKDNNKKLIIWLAALGIGIVVFFIQLIATTVADGIVFMLLIWGLANIGNILKEQPDNRSVKKQVKDAIDEANNPGATFLGKVAGFFIGYAIIAVSLPIQIIILLLMKKKNEKIHEENVSILNALS